MNNEEFWQLISLIDIDALNEGDEEVAVEALTEKLSTKNEKEIGEFEELLSQYLYKIDGKKWCDESGESSDSADGFLYARCYVVARGREFYEAVLSNPSLMPKSSDEWAETLLFVAAQAWAEATGNEEENFELFASVSSETGSNDAQW
jgi:hypothetical protein